MDPHELFLRPGSPRNSVGSARVSDKVRSGLVGSGRARVVEFSLNFAKMLTGIKSPVLHLPVNLSICIYHCILFP